MLELKLGFFQKFAWGEGLGIELDAQPTHLRDKGLQQFNSLPLPHEMLCSSTWVFL